MIAWHFLQMIIQVFSMELKNKIDKKHLLKNLKLNCIEDILY